MEDELVLVTASSNRSLRQEEIAAADLKKLPLVIRETGSGTLDVVERALASRGISLRTLPVEMQLDSTETVSYTHLIAPLVFETSASTYSAIRARCVSRVQI